MKKNLFWYEVGLAVIGVFVIGVAIFVIMQAGNTKQDAATDKKANSIADKLNSYVTDHQTIPQSLTEVGVTGVPSTITYQKLGASSYKFCVTYKNNSSGFDATSAVIDAVSGTSVDTSGDGLSSSYDKYSLNVDTTHHKGINCQTIKPIIYQSSPTVCNYTYSSSSITSCPEIPSHQPAQSTSTHPVCGFGQQPSSSCTTGCPQYVQPSYAVLYDGTVKTLTMTQGGVTKQMTITTANGTTVTVVVNGDTKGFNQDCTSIDSSDIVEGNKVRVNVSGQEVANHVTPTSREIIDFDL